MTQKRQCYARISGHPDLAARAAALDSRLRGNDTRLKDLILKDPLHWHPRSRKPVMSALAERYISNDCRLRTSGQGRDEIARVTSCAACHIPPRISRCLRR